MERDKAVRDNEVGGDKTATGDISRTGAASGRGASASVTQGIGGTDLAILFAPVLEEIQRAPTDKKEVA